MRDLKTVDARGLSCPQPVLLARRALKAAQSGALEILVDSGTARDNVARLGTKEGWSVAVEEQADGVYRVRLSKA
jgi:tRNA 2-thiouridine synthesizing protein A